MTKHSKVYFLAFMCSFCLNTLLCAQDGIFVGDSLFDNFTNTYSSEFFSEKYHNYTLEHFMDNYYPNGHYQIETTGNFSQPDQYVFSLTGYSFKWNKYYYDGIRMNDLSFPGGTLHKPMLHDKDLSIDIIDSRINNGTMAHLVIGYHGPMLTYTLCMVTSLARKNHGSQYPEEKKHALLEQLTSLSQLKNMTTMDMLQ
ncbi:MAG: hypothetical protein NWS46_07380 [Cyclobacteriaceae bacterium]|nr:hypothetical protein [Cyclobacteriaceae bacterium]